MAQVCFEVILSKSMYLQEVAQVFLQRCHLIFPRKLQLLFYNVVLHFWGSFVVGTIVIS